MHKYLLTIFLIAQAIPAHTAWEQVDADVKKGEAHFFDSDTMRREGHSFRVWVLSNYDEERVGGYRSVKTFYEFDCLQRKARSQTMLLYPDVMAQGEVIGAHHEESKEWFSFSSSSVFGRILQIVCVN